MEVITVVATIIAYIVFGLIIVNCIGLITLGILVLRNRIKTNKNK